jgi:hypothetical protein
MEVRLGAWMPFEHVAEFLAETVKANRSKPTVHRETVKAGQALVDAESKATEWLSKAVPESHGPAVAHQQISVDGAMVPLIGRWAEVKTVAIGTIVATDAGPKAKDLSYFSRKADHGTFSQQATLETHRRATHKAEKVTAVVDGAEWIQEFLDLQCPAAVRIIDWAHSSSYVAQAAQALFSDPGEAADWRGAQLNLLLHGDPQGVLDELCFQLGRCGPGTDQEAVVVTSLGYLAKRLDQIQYRQYREAGLPIGSGIVESANKVVVEQRLKGAGMRWKDEHVDPMLALRNAICSSGRWADSWRVLHAYRRRVAAERAHAAHCARHPVPAPPPRKPKRHPRAFRDFRLAGSRPRAKT